MAEITLSEYCEEAKKLIRADSYDQAIAICRHILRHFPKHVRSYRLLGEASLEKGDYVEAANLFKRVLSVDLEDVVVYVGLSIVYDEEGALEEAIWQLERAFELSPGNAEIRKELQRLYGERDGTAPPKLKLTPAALGRLYLREGLYQRAVDELKSVLQEDPERSDIQATLAQALWWSEQRREAAEVCEHILEKFPNSLKANLILGEILLNGGREEGRTLLRTAQAIDPENIVSQELFREQSPLPLETVRIPRLGATELQEQAEEISLEAAPAAKETEPEAAPPLIPEEELEGAMPDWLRKLQEGEKEPTTEGAASAIEAKEMPDWLRELAEDKTVEPEAAAAIGEHGLPAGEEEMPDWVGELRAAPEAAQPEEASLPSGPDEAGVEEEPALEGMKGQSQVTTPPEEELPSAEEEEAVASEATLADLQETVPDDSASIDEIMAWMERARDQTDEEEPSEEQIEEGPTPSDEAPGWLRELREEATAQEETVPGPELEEEEMVDSLHELRAEEAESVLPEEPAVPAPEEEVPTWLLDLRQEAGGEEVTADAKEAVGPGEGAPDEEEEGESLAVAALEEELPALEEEEVEISRETMTRLRETMPDESASIEEIMAWMERSKAMLPEEETVEEALEEGTEAMPKAAEQEVPSIEEEEVPAWLRALKREPEEAETEVPAQEAEAPVDEAAVPTEEEEIPTWLRELRPDSEEELAAPGEEAETQFEEEPVPTLEEEEVPSWLRELRAEAAEEEAAIPSEDAEVPAEETPFLRMEEEEVPSWLRELRAEAAEEEAAIPSEDAEVPAEETPFLRMEEEEAPSWLRELRAEAAKEEVIIASEEAEAPAEETPLPLMEEEELPSWLRELRAEAAKEEVIITSEEAEAPAEEAPLPPMEEEEVPSWLRELRAEATKEEAAITSEEAEAPAARLVVEEPGRAVEDEAELVPAEDVIPPSAPEEPPDREIITAEEHVEVAPVEEKATEEATQAGWSIEDYRKHLESDPRDHRTRLALARVHSREGELDQAVSQYEVILSYGQLFEEVIEDLEAMADRARDHLATHELLADAYMKGGRLQKALDKYRWLRVMLAS
ncbi:MAG: hypothetical protein CEE40_01305 [Chloroflexi bacterium B3_Chlor]|nr:MAG: hypothetical protein CEE40_01305 [Chloroflexi bacterium B3_Chlor]